MEGKLLGSVGLEPLRNLLTFAQPSASSTHTLIPKPSPKTHNFFLSPGGQPHCPIGTVKEPTKHTRAMQPAIALKGPGLGFRV